MSTVLAMSSARVAWRAWSYRWITHDWSQQFAWAIKFLGFPRQFGRFQRPLWPIVEQRTWFQASHGFQRRIYRPIVVVAGQARDVGGAGASRSKSGTSACRWRCRSRFCLKKALKRSPAKFVHVSKMLPLTSRISSSANDDGFVCSQVASWNKP